MIALLLFSIVNSATTGFKPAPYSAFTNWAPIIIIAALLGTTLAGVYYMIGYLLNNPRIRASAISEFEQAIGSIALVIVVIGVLYMLGTTDFSFGSFLGAKGVSSISNICSTYLNPPSGTAYPAYLSSNFYDSGSTPPGLPEPTTAVCQYLIGAPLNKVSSSDPITTNIDYGLAATYVIMANMTNQSVYELNAVYNLDSILFFLRNLNPYVGFCIPGVCVDPFTPAEGINIRLGYKPFQGYVFQRSIMPSIVTQATLTLYMETLELMIIIILLVFWPYLLGAGIVLRTIPFTRRAGGLIIAATIVGVIILPTIFLLEYHALNNIQSQTFVGASQIPGVALCGFGPVPASHSNNVLWCYTSANVLKTSYIYKGTQPARFKSDIPACTGQLNPNNGEFTNGENPYSNEPKCFVQRNLSFYTYPDAAGIISLYSCYPTDTTIIPVEFDMIVSAMVQAPLSLNPAGLMALFSNAVNQQGANSGVNALLTPVPGGSCISKIGPHNTSAVLTSLVNMYGIITVSGFIIPILNFLILLSAMTGISSLIGGETTIIGLSRFI